MAREINAGLVYATTVSFDQDGILIMGASGSGKSQLAIELMALGANLVSDDQTYLMNKDTYLYASPPKTIEGRIELRSIGIIQVGFVSDVIVKLCIDLDAAPFQRYPKAENINLFGIDIPKINGKGLHALASSVKVMMSNIR